MKNTKEEYKRCENRSMVIRYFEPVILPEEELKEKITKLEQQCRKMYIQQAIMLKKQGGKFYYDNLDIFNFDIKIPIIIEHKTPNGILMELREE